MDQGWLILLVLLTMLGNALLAGAFFAFIGIIAPGLRELPDDQYVQALRRVNTTLTHPGLMLLSVGTPALTVATAIALFSGWAESWLVLLAAGLAVASFLITTMISWPLQRLLAQREANLAWQQRRARTEFQLPWNRWNVLRTLCSAGALLALSAQLL